MALAKLTILAEKTSRNKFDEKIPVMFNPSEISTTIKGYDVDEHGHPAPSQDGENKSPDFSIKLFFDTTLTGIPPKNVQIYTKPVVQLTQPRIGTNQKRPPRCKIVWGTIAGKDTVLFPDGFLSSVTKTLTHFYEDGTPVRATLDCSFTLWQPKRIKQKLLNLIDDPVRIVKRGETLSSIAIEEYGDPALWRIIAAENRLMNPRKIRPGMVLTIPPLTVSNITGGER